MKKALFTLVVAALGLGFSAARAADLSPAGLCTSDATLSVPALGEVISVERVFDPENPDRVQGEIIQTSGGCTATVNCFHGGQQSCSSPTGTCTVSHAQCGWVQCGNQNPKICAGSCRADHHCFFFCGGDEGAFCAFDFCCECSN